VGDGAYVLPSQASSCLGRSSISRRRTRYITQASCSAVHPLFLFNVYACIWPGSDAWSLAPTQYEQASIAIPSVPYISQHMSRPASPSVDTVVHTPTLHSRYKPAYRSRVHKSSLCSAATLTPTAIPSPTQEARTTACLTPE